MKKDLIKNIILSVLTIILSFITLIFALNTRFLPFNPLILLFIPISLILLLVFSGNKKISKIISLILIIIPSLVIVILSTINIISGIKNGSIVDYREKIYMSLIVVYYLIQILLTKALLIETKPSLMNISRIVLIIISILIYSFVFMNLLSSGTYIFKTILYSIIPLSFFIMYPITLNSIEETSEQ